MANIGSLRGSEDVTGNHNASSAAGGHREMAKAKAVI